MFDHADALHELDESLPLAEKLRVVHDVINRDVAGVDRVAIALYEAKTDLVKTFIHSSGGAQPLPHYSAPLAQAPALREVVERRCPRYTGDLFVVSPCTLDL